VSFPRYESYRDTGIQWLGSVPSHWRAAPFWSLFRRTKRTGFPEAELLSVYRDYGVIRKSDRDDNFNNPSDDLNSYQIVRPGDLVINKMKAWQGSLGISSINGIVSPAYFVFEPLHDETSRYLHYLLRSPPLAAGFMTISKGIRPNQWDIDPDHLSQLSVSLPPNAEQIAIVTFLDRETAKIDASIEGQRRLIELLQEKRQAVISHAVTRGLDASVRMKDSGVEWLGRVPEHWTVVPLKRMWSVTDCKHITPEFVEDGFPLASIREVAGRFVDLNQARRTTSGYFKQMIEGGREPQPGDLIFSRNATVGEVAEVADWHPPFAMGQDVCLLRRLDSGASPTFLYMTLKSDHVSQQLSLAMVGATFKRVNVEDIRNLAVLCPPVEEQWAIAAALEAIDLKLTALMGEAERAMILLQEHRAALISAAVAGSIDVRVASSSSWPNLDRRRLRLVVGAAIVEAIANRPNSGRTKLHKIVYLTQAHAGVHELEGAYLRQAAGPLDADLLDEMEAELQKSGHVSVEQPGGRGSQVTYKISGKRGVFRSELDAALGPRASVLDKLVADLCGLDTKHVEAVTTLYAVWNDALLDGDRPSDDTIVSGVLNDWHPEKRQKFRATELHTWLDWMRRHGLVPQGQGPRTTRGRLFV